MIRNRNLATYSYETRIRALAACIVLFGAVLTYRLADLQIFGARQLQATAARQQTTSRIVPAERGSIYYTEKSRAELFPLATNRVFQQLYIVPREVTDVDATVGALLPFLQPSGMTEETLRYRVGKENDIYEPLARKLTEQEAADIITRAIPGVYVEDDRWRYYPEGETLAHVLGFVGVQDNQRIGQYGLEGNFETELKGVDGILEGDVDSTGRLLEIGSLRRTDPTEGVDIVLTIDRVIQSFACDALKKRITEVDAASGSLIIVDPETGAIRAMCAYPSFDPNNYGAVSDIGVYLNPTISLAYEPGSIFKPLTLAAAINEKKITPDTTYVDEGSVEINGYTIKNFDGKGRGEVTMVKVLEDSLNTGAIFAQRQIGNNKFREYVEAFGFGTLTGIELASENAGDIKALSKKSDIYFATPSFGQGITVTPIQMVMSFNTIASGGALMKPYIIAEKWRNDKKIYTATPEVASHPISVGTATVMSAMLVSVVNEGYDNHGGVKGYYIAGKTGTAQVAANGVYGSKTIHSFAGFGPVEHPVFTMLIKLNYPSRGLFASSTTAPLFGEIAEFILHYYEIPPTAEE